jgi:diacylglycerol kinase (ATP)
VTHSAAAFFASFRYATAGVRLLFLRQRNARIQAIIGVVALGLGVFLQLSRLDWALLVLTIALVLALEGVNTALEAVVDLATTEYHPLAKAAKDLAAGAVWLSALAAIAIGALLFVPPLLRLVGNR